MTKKDACNSNCAPRLLLIGSATLALLTFSMVAALATYHLWPTPAAPVPYEAGGAPTEAQIKNLCGWSGQQSAADAWEQLKGHFPEFKIIRKVGAAPVRDDKRVALWDAAKAVNGGRHLPTFRQEIGDCVSMGAANACNYLLCVQIITSRGLPQEYHPSFQPFIYGISRVQIGGGGLGGDGSNGVWAARGLQQYGTLPADAKGVPPYSGSVARAWGRRPGPPAEFLPIAAKNLVKTAAKVTRWEDARDALVNGYPVTIASNVGFAMRPDNAAKKLYGVPSGSWAHQMCLIGYDPAPEPSFYVINSWGENAHGAPLDDAPPGGFWIKSSACQRVVAQGDSFALSEQIGFPAREWNLDLIRQAKARVDDARRVAESSPFQLAP